MSPLRRKIVPNQHSLDNPHIFSYRFVDRCRSVQFLLEGLRKGLASPPLTFLLFERGAFETLLPVLGGAFRALRDLDVSEAFLSCFCRFLSVAAGCGFTFARSLFGCACRPLSCFDLSSFARSFDVLAADFPLPFGRLNAFWASLSESFEPRAAFVGLPERGARFLAVSFDE